MYFIGDISKSGKLGIVDTKDCKIEYFDEAFIRQNLSQVFIAGLENVKSFVSSGAINVLELIGNDELEKLNRKLFKRMFVCTNKGNTNEFFTDYYSQLCCFDSVVPIFSESAKSTLLNYTETSDKAIMLYEQNDCCSISATNSMGYYNKVTDWSKRDYHIPKLYPCGSGRLFNLDFKRRFGFNDLNLNEDSLFVKLVSNTSTAFVKVTNYGFNGLEIICEKEINGVYE